MSRSLYPARGSTARWSPCVEPLESRRLFAASLLPNLPGPPSFVPAWSTPAASNLPSDLSTLSVTATDPADGSVVNQSPTTLNITFNQPFDPSTIGLDLGLVRLAPDGSVLEDLGGLLFEDFGLTGAPTTLPVTIDGTLAPGRYGIVLLGSMSLLSGLPQNGDPGAPLINSGVDQTVATFTVAAPGTGLPAAPTLADAIDLGTLGPQMVQTLGSLDLQSNIGNYQLYKFTVAPGHFWRFGAEVNAQRNLGTLNSALALFDSQGNLLKSDDIGRPDVPADPYLFDGLQPGTYYLGVSNSGDLPNVAGGYDPVAGQYGTVGLSQTGGSYQLQVIAQVQDAPTELKDVQLQYADPLDPRPTGISIVFSGPMDINSFVNAVHDGAFQGLQVVDAKGTVWPLTPLSYNESNGQFTFLFSQPLPAGHYTLLTPSQGSVTDLAGLVPVGQGNGNSHNPVLAKWNVTHADPPPIPNNLGTVLTDRSSSSSTKTQLLPGQTITYRFVAPAAGVYDLQAFVAGGTVRMQAIGSEGQVARDIGSSDLPLTGSMRLNCGVYYLQFTATGSTPVNVTFTIYRPSVGAETVFDNGVGQGIALNLALIAPSTPPPANPTAWVAGADFGPAPLGAGTGTTTAPEAPHSPTAHGATVAGTTIESPSGTAGLVLTLGSSLVGSPLAGAETVSAVGPGIQSGVTALAANTTGVLQGITYGQSLGLSSSFAGSNGADAIDVGPVVAEPPSFVDGALTVTTSVARPDMDRTVLATASNWLGGIGSAVLNWFGGSAATPSEPAEEPEEPIERVLLTRDDLVPPRPSQVEHADLATPLGLSVLSVLALRLRQPARRWLNERRGRPGRRPSATPRGPHARI